MLAAISSDSEFSERGAYSAADSPVFANNNADDDVTRKPRRSIFIFGHFNIRKTDLSKEILAGCPNPRESNVIVVANMMPISRPTSASQESSTDCADYVRF